MNEIAKQYQDIIKIVTGTIDYLLGKNGVAHENRSADAVADLTKTLLDRFPYADIIASAAPEDIEALQTLSGWKTD